MTPSLFISTDPLFWILATIAMLMVGICKSGFGGMALLAVPIMSLAISPILAAAIALPVLIIMDFTALRAFWGQWDMGIVKLLVPAALVGVVIGGVGFSWLSVDQVKLILGLIAITFTLHYWFSAALNRAIRKPGKGAGFLLAIATGFTSHVAHAGGPPYSMYVLPQRLPRHTYVGTTVLVFTIINLAKTLPYAFNGQFTKPVLMTALVLLPLAPVGFYLGRFLLDHLSEIWFYRVSYALIFLIGIKLLADVLV